MKKMMWIILVILTFYSLRMEEYVFSKEGAASVTSEFQDNNATTTFSLYIENEDQTDSTSSDSTTSESQSNTFYNDVLNFIKTSGENLVLLVFLVISLVTSCYLFFALKKLNHS